MGQNRFLMITADTIDGRYSAEGILWKISFMKMSSRLNVPVEITGSSFSISPNSLCVNALSKLSKSVRLRAREEVSRQRMEKHLCKPVELTADVAFLLIPEEETFTAKKTIAWIAIA